MFSAYYFCQVSHLLFPLFSLIPFPTSLPSLLSLTFFLVLQSILFGFASKVAAFNSGLFIFFICIIASLYGGSKVVFPPLVSQIFHRENQSVVTGLVLLAVAAASGLGPNLAAALGTDAFFLACSIMTTLGSFALIPLKPLPQEERKMQVKGQEGS